MNAVVYVECGLLDINTIFYNITDNLRFIISANIVSIMLSFKFSFLNFECFEFTSSNI